jgi:hypothetical protein
MPIRTDRIYALVSNAYGKFPHLPAPHIYSRIIAEGHQRPIRKHVDTPFWFREGPSQHLRLLKNAYRLGDMFRAFRFICSARCVEAVRSVCPNLRYQPAFIHTAFYVEYDFDGTIHVPREDQFLEPSSPEDPTETPDEWVDRLAVKYRSPIPRTEWFEIVLASGSQTCAAFPTVREIESFEYGGVSSIDFRPEAVEMYGWVALGETCVSATVMQALDEFLPRPYTYALPITLDGYPCINEAW